MSDYTKTTNYAAKTTSSPVLGAEWDVEFNNIATADASKTEKIAVPVANRVLKMDANGDAQDTGHATPTGTFVGTTDSQTVSNKAWNALTSLTAANNLDIGSYKLQANQFESDILNGVGPPLIVASTTQVTNLNVDLIGGKDITPVQDIHLWDGLGDEVLLKTYTGIATATGWDTTYTASLDDGTKYILARIRVKVSMAGYYNGVTAFFATDYSATWSGSTSPYLAYATGAAAVSGYQKSFSAVVVLEVSAGNIRTAYTASHANSEMKVWAIAKLS